MKILAPFEWAKTEYHIKLVQEKLLELMPAVERELGLSGDVLDF